MGGIDRHHNADFDGGSPNIPLALNDRLWGQDWQRQFWFQMEQAAIVVKDTLGSNGLLSLGGSIVKGTGWDDIDIPEAVGYAEFDVTIQDEGETWQVPALTKTVTLESIRVRTPAVTDFDISGATLDGATTNYLKMAYAESDGRTRQKNNDPVTWAFEKVQSVLITANSTPATSKEVLLATFIGDGSSTLTIIEGSLLGIDKGFLGIALTNYTSTTVSAIAAGGEVEINGKKYYNPLEIAITGSTSNSTWYDILLTPSGTTFTASFIARGTGTWSDSKHGLYSGNNRVVACVYKDASGNFISKNILNVINRTIEIKMEIGDWDMDATAGVNITHGLSDYTKIRSLSAMIINDAENAILPLSVGGTEASSNATVTALSRNAGEAFDSVDYDSTSFNRGWLTIKYEG